MRTKQAAFWPKLSRPSLLSRFFLFSNFYWNCFCKLLLTGVDVIKQDS
jgi:hypothetical protein